MYQLDSVHQLSLGKADIGVVGACLGHLEDVPETCGGGGSQESMGGDLS